MFVSVVGRDFVWGAAIRVRSDEAKLFRPEQTAAEMSGAARGELQVVKQGK